MDHETLCRLLKRIREMNPGIKDDELHHEAAMAALKNSQKSWAYYRVNAIRNMTAGKSLTVSKHKQNALEIMHKVDAEHKGEISAAQSRRRKTTHYDDDVEIVCFQHRNFA